MPSNVSLKPIVCLETARAETVADLMMEGSRIWNVDILKDNFIQMDVKAVQKIKLGVHGMEDLHAWTYERSRVYSALLTGY